MPEFLFDLRLNASLCVTAATEDEARALLREHVHGVIFKFGCWPTLPILGEASFDDGEADLMAVDGVEVA